MANRFLTEREGQMKFFEKFAIGDTELANNTDGVFKGTIFEFKKTISNINAVLFQAIKYLSHMRVKGESIPANILLVALNEDIAYQFKAEDYILEIEKVYAGAASKNNSNFSARTSPLTIHYNSPAGIRRITEILDYISFVKVHIDVFDVVGWANRFYRENLSASKIQLFKELRAPKYFAKYIYPWKGDEKDFQYIMDLLNDKQHKKELGAFYTPPAYCLKATELVRKAIKQIPHDHDYIILDRCAGTGNLEEFLTDKPVNDITIGELNKYIDKNFKKEYLASVGDGIDLILNKGGKKLSEITLEDLKKYETSLKIRDFIFDNELSHAIVNTYELKEWVVLNARIGDRVKLIIPPEQEVKNTSALVNGGDALSTQFVTGQRALGMTKEYNESIGMLLDFVKSKKTNIILLENPPYRDSSAANTDHSTNRTSKGTFVFEAMKKDLVNLANSNISTARDISNQFIWSAWQHYLRKADDYFVLFSPIKYWKSLGLGEKKFIDGFLFNRNFFHAGPSAISCVLWQNQNESKTELNLKAFDIDDKGTPEQEDDEVRQIQDKITIKKATHTLEPFFDRRKFVDDQETVVFCEGDGTEITGRKTDGRALYNKNIIAYMVPMSFTPDPKHIVLTRQIWYGSRGFYLRADNFIDKLPLFAAKLYPQKYWYERDIYFTTADGGNRYLQDKDFLKACFIFASLSQRNHCRSFDGSDGRFYKNELCFDSGTLSSAKLKNYKLTKVEQDLLKTFSAVLARAKKTKNYNKKYKYGTYQIDEDLNTRHKNDNDDEWVYDDAELNTIISSLKTKLSKYYESVIQPKLFEYQLLK